MREYNRADYDTLRERDVKLKLTDEEVESLCREAARRNTTVEELLEDFVANLTGSIRNRGSDERELAYQYVERCIYSFDDNESFLQWLSVYDELESVLVSLGEIDEIEAHKDRYEDAEDELEYHKQEVEDAYEEYKNAGGKEEWYKALEQLRAYQKTKERLKA